MPITTKVSAKDPAGTTVFAHGTSYRADGTLSAVTAETSLVILDASEFDNAVLIVDLGAITGGGNFIVKVYNVDMFNQRAGAAVATSTQAAAGVSRTAISAPIGNFLEVTFELTGTTPTATIDGIELQLKS